MNTESWRLNSSDTGVKGQFPDKHNFQKKMLVKVINVLEAGV